MKTSLHGALAGAILLLALAAAARADAVRLVNGDTLNGEVVALDKESLTLASKNFGELTIPRDKVELIYLGKGTPPFAPPAAAAPAQGAGATPQLPPSLFGAGREGQMNQLLQQLLGGQDTQQNLDQKLEGLKDLQKDLGPGPEGQALDAYMKMLDMLRQVGKLGQGSQPAPAPGAKEPPPSKLRAPAEQP